MAIRKEYKTVEDKNKNDLPSLGAAEQPMPTQEDRNTPIVAQRVQWDAAIEDARKAGVQIEWSGNKKQKAEDRPAQKEEDD